MRYSFAVLILMLLLAVLPGMNVLAAPVPDPSAILDIGPPPRDSSMEKHLETQIGEYLTSPHGRLFDVWLDPEIRQFPSFVAQKDARSWLTKNLQVTKEGGSRLRLTFRAGNRREQVAILNALLHSYIKVAKEAQKSHERELTWEEDVISSLERRIASGQHRESLDSDRKAIEKFRSILIPARRAEIARWKQIAVIKWAK